MKFLEGGYTSYSERSLKKFNLMESVYGFINGMDWFSLVLASTVFATFWYLIFRCLFSDYTKDPPANPKKE